MNNYTKPENLQTDPAQMPAVCLTPGNGSFTVRTYGSRLVKIHEIKHTAKSRIIYMPELATNAQENLTRFVQGELELAEDFLEDARAYLQLQRFFLAVESIQNSSRAMDIVQDYLGGVSDAEYLYECRNNLNTLRERVRTLEQSITVQD